MPPGRGRSPPPFLPPLPPAFAVRRLPEIIAHRGTPREHPENTLAGFAAALEQGADGIELDVHGTADGQVVVHHDSDLGAHVTPEVLAGRALAGLTAADVQSVTLPPGASGAPAGLPTLRDVLALVGDRATVYVEVKAAGIEAEVIRVLASAGVRAAVHAFDHRIAHAIARASAAPAGILLASYLLDPAHALEAAGARDYWCAHEFIDAALVHAVHGVGGRVVAWTVNDAAAANRLLALGVDAICTDIPGGLRAALGA